MSSSWQRVYHTGKFRLRGRSFFGKNYSPSHLTGLHADGYLSGTEILSWSPMQFIIKSLNNGISATEVIIIAESYM
jgi:hypothetical protein